MTVMWWWILYDYDELYDDDSYDNVEIYDEVHGDDDMSYMMMKMCYMILTVNRWCWESYDYDDRSYMNMMTTIIWWWYQLYDYYDDDDDDGGRVIVIKWWWWWQWVINLFFIPHYSAQSPRRDSEK